MWDNKNCPRDVKYHAGTMTRCSSEKRYALMDSETKKIINLDLLPVMQTQNANSLQSIRLMQPIAKQET